MSSQALAAKLGSDKDKEYYGTPSWNQTLPADTRFVVLNNMNAEAVLDKETGLVWEQTPAALPLVTWNEASARCMNLAKGGRLGWRLPSAQELMSLIRDPAVGSTPPILPVGHPFTVTSAPFDSSTANYWTATLDIRNAENAWVVNIWNGTAQRYTRVDPVYRDATTWCVRGGPGAGTQ